MRKKLLIALLSAYAMLAIDAKIARAQKTAPKHTISLDKQRVYYLKNATITTSPGVVLKNADLLIVGDKIAGVGTGLTKPFDAIEIDASELYIYPGFIELFSDYGIKKLEGSGARGIQFNPQLESNRKGATYWNDAVKPENQSIDHFEQDAKKAEELRKLGFSTVLSHHQDGIARGTGVLSLLNDQAAQESVLKAKAAHFLSFSKGTSTQSYPSSLMGVIALLRQVHYDAQWYEAGGKKEEYNRSLEAWNANKNLPAIIETRGDKLNLLRAAQLGKEIGLKFILMGNGDEYQRAEAIKSTGLSLVLPLQFPEALDVSDPLESDYVSLKDMKHWEWAPQNPRVMDDNKIPFSFTISNLKKTDDFHKVMHEVVSKGGLKEESALAALTIQPAKELGMEQTIGKLEKNYLANFIICSGPLFGKETQVLQNWVAGKSFEYQKLSTDDVRGKYEMIVGVDTLDWIVSGSRWKQDHKISKRTDSSSFTPKVSRNEQLISFSVKNFKDSLQMGGYRFDGRYIPTSRAWKGSMIAPDGSITNWDAKYLQPAPDTATKKDKKIEKDTLLSSIVYPFSGYGLTSLPATQNVLFKNTTVWTNEKEGILPGVDVWIESGKIKQIGKGLSASGVKVINAEGLHLTSGIIDEHSHIAISRGVNEGGQMNSAEVRVGDVINSEDINLYRQVASGVIGAQLLHGSANAVGGQSALVKFRWGSLPEDMKIKGADGFIKFALGENPKSANSGNFSRNVFPQTRMGIEQLYYDAFFRALEYERQQMAFQKLSSKEKLKAVPPRKDLELDVMLEILQSKRFISCHSYVQSEIAMLMKVADSLGFKINTFTHILEGYKLAAEMKEHGVYASSFADWWAYKWEVKDAIPYNMAILSGAGVTTSVNSDDPEMARRLNQEAAKGVKYGNMTGEEAWKMATLNPAKMLHLDNITGSIKVGKDADLVLWNNNPLSIYARPVQTWIDGALYFDQQEDEAMRKRIHEERQRLIQKLLKAKDQGATLQKPVKKEKQHHYHCDHESDEGGF